MTVNLMSLNDNKAGMKELDTERINAIILEHSKGSKFYENQQRKQEQLQKRIDEKLKQLERITPAMIKKGESEGDEIVKRIRGERELNRYIVHVDMDAFYAAVEMRDNPSLRRKAMAVGGMSMLSTSNYIARRFGVRAAMPGFIAKKLCPELTIVPANFEKYSAVSHQVREIMAEYDPNYVTMSLDEAYLDITEYMKGRPDLPVEDRTFTCRHVCACDELSMEEKEAMTKENADSACKLCMGAYSSGSRTFGMSPADVCRELRWRIFDATQLTASAGLAPNTLLAKIASDKNKPNGQCEVKATEDDIALFIRHLHVRKIPGIGNVSEQILKALGVITCADIYEKRGILFHLCTPCNFQYYLRTSVGEGDSFLSNDSERKSMSVERTFNEISKAAELLEKCRELSDALAEDLSERRMKGRTVTLKLKLVTFEVRTRAQTLQNLTSNREEIYSAASDLLRNEINSSFPDRLRLRLMGVRMSGLVDNHMVSNTQQLSLKECFKKAASDKRNERQRQPLPTSDNNSLIEPPRSSLKNQSTLENAFLKVKAKDVSKSLPTRSEAAASSLPSSDPKPSSQNLPEPSSEQKSLSKQSQCDSSLEIKSNEIILDPQPAATQNISETVQEVENENEEGNDHSPPRSPVFDNSSQREGSDEKSHPDSPPSWKGYPCPVCSKMQLVQNETQFHAHLDFCLSRGAISEAIRKADNECTPPSPKRKRLSASKSTSQDGDSTVTLLKYFSRTNSQ